MVIFRGFFYLTWRRDRIFFGGTTIKFGLFVSLVFSAGHIFKLELLEF